MILSLRILRIVDVLHIYHGFRLWQSVDLFDLSSQTDQWFVNFPNMVKILAKFVLPFSVVQVYCSGAFLGLLCVHDMLGRSKQLFQGMVNFGPPYTS